MTLAPGSRLGAYEITGPLGEGGMGVVYRATDSKLKREVAIKVLPHAFAADAERLARFEREAQLLAQLQHPSIASIYGLEESNGVRALVMELVEGEDLAERLKRGPLPLDEGLAVARQIAEALEAAHEKGIVHRDLKPANVKLTPDCKVKVLDFGLAKALDPAPASGSPRQSPTLMNSPTLTAAGTALGVILGTAAYMAPEQAKGQAVDRRADIWAFGVVLWECLSGKALFAADSVAETIGNVMTREPDAALLPRETPAAVRELLGRCLVRDPRHRLQAIGDARIALEELAAGPRREAVAGPAAPRGAVYARYALGAAIGASLAIGAFALAGRFRAESHAPGAGAGRESRRTEIVGLSVVDFSSVAISPDGSEVVGYDVTPSQSRLLRRSLDSFDIRPIPGTESGYNPFFSPDGQSIGFFGDQNLCVVRLDGSARRCLAEAGGFAAGSWGRDGSIVFSSQPPAGGAAAGLWRVPSAGGEPVRLTTVDAAQGERQHVYPQVLPDGRNVLYSIVGEVQSSVALVPLAGGASRPLLSSATRARYVPSGHLVYWDESRGRLSAVPFDLDRLAASGRPAELGLDLATTGDAIVSYDVSEEGTLVYSRTGQFGDDFTVERTDRNGRGTPLLAERASWAQPRVSPDGKTLLIRRSAQPDCTLWRLDLERGSLSRLGVEGDAHNPLWMPDGERILVSLTAAMGVGSRQVVEMRVDGAGSPTPLQKTGFAANAEAVSPDGRFVALTRDGRRERNDIFVHDRQSGETKPFLDTGFDEDHPAISPDGTLIAYAANDSGRREVYVRPFGAPGAKYAVSNSGGTGPVWSRDGRELFYAEGNKLMSVAVERSPRFAASVPRLLFENADFVWERVRNYDVLSDGSGFVFVRRGQATPSTRSLRVVSNWFTELERLAPKGARP